KDEMAWENYGYAFVIDAQAALNTDGSITAWDHESWSAVMGGRPGGNNPGNVASGFLAGFAPQPFAARSPAPDGPAAGPLGNGSNAIPSYVSSVTGTVASQRVLTHNV